MAVSGPYLSRGDGHGGGFRVLEEGLAKARSSGFDGGRRGGRCSCLASVVNWVEGAAYVQCQQCHAHWRSCRFAVRVWFVSVCLILPAVVRGTGRGGRRDATTTRRPPPAMDLLDQAIIRCDPVVEEVDITGQLATAHWARFS